MGNMTVISHWSRTYARTLPNSYFFVS